MKDSMNENVLEWLRGDKTVKVTLCSGKLCNRVKKLAIKHPDEVKVHYYNKDGSIFAEIPLPYIKISKPIKQELTEEERETRREKMLNVLKHREDIE